MNALLISWLRIDTMPMACILKDNVCYEVFVPSIRVQVRYHMHAPIRITSVRQSILPNAPAKLHSLPMINDSRELIVYGNSMD